MNKIFTIYIFFVILNLMANETYSQVIFNKQNKNLFVEHSSLINNTIDELIIKRQSAFDNGQSVSELDDQIEGLIIQNSTNEPSGNPKAIPANDNCSNAQNIIIEAPLICSQTTQNASVQSGETVCGTVAGGSPETVWYRFKATNDSLVVSFILTNNANCYPFIGVYGPFNTGAGCLPSGGSNLFCQYMGLTDPGFHKLITGLTIGKEYLISIQGTDCGGTNDRFSKFCIGIASPALNTTAIGSHLIDKCGASFSGNTNIGNYPSGSSAGFNNLDNNVLTTVTGASQTGDDVNFVINNDTWFKFCPIYGGTWQITLNGITNCTLPSPPNQGIQAAVFTGNPNNLTNIYSFPNPMAMGSSNTSTTFSVTAGQCAYIVVDGFAGDACNYNLALANITGECKVLPVELIEFKATQKNNQVELNWVTASENNNDYFTLLKSTDANNFKEIAIVNGAGNASNNTEYKVVDNEPIINLVYYKLKQTDYDGKFTYSDVIPFNSSLENYINDLNVNWNSQTKSINLNFKGSNDFEYELYITDISGKSIYNSHIYANSKDNVSFEFQLNSLQKGVYFVTVVSNNFKENKKLVVW